ncbi:MAG: peptide chain release factor N(5)-glutamine methyltransferase [Eubacterium sp.]
MTLKQAYSYSVQFLERNKVDEADFKALCLVCHLAGIRNSEYNAHINDDIIMSRLAKKLWRLKSGEPLQYVIGRWDFYESEFYIGKGVLIPRPETEELVEQAIKYAGDYNNPVVYDLCAGSGCIGISIAKSVPGSKVYCIEKSSDAFVYLKKNAENVGNVTIINDDINNDIDLPIADIIISNPPYIRSSDIDALQSEVQFEPRMALDGGDDGFAFYRVINSKWSDKIKNNGTLLLEIGNDQGAEIKKVLSNFNHVTVKKDIYKNDRIVIAKRLD